MIINQRFLLKVENLFYLMIRILYITSKQTKTNMLKIMGKSINKILFIFLHMIVGVLLVVSCVSNTNSSNLTNKRSLTTYKIYGANIPLKTGAGETFENLFIYDNPKDSTIKKIAQINYICKVVILEENGEWIKVQVVEPENLRENYIGWIPKKHIETPPQNPQMNTFYSTYQENVKLYGKITADCIGDQKIRVGMREEALSLIKTDEWIKINMTETSSGVSKQYVYRNNKYVYVENGIVTAIQSEGY